MGLAFIARITTSELFVGWIFGLFQRRYTIIRRGIPFGFPECGVIVHLAALSCDIPTKVFKPGALGRREIASQNALKYSGNLVIKRCTNASSVALLPKETNYFWRKAKYV